MENQQPELEKPLETSENPSNIEQITISPPPLAPNLDLSVLNKPKKPDPVKDKLIEKASKFQGDPTLEVSQKYKLTEDKNPECLQEADATGIKPEENLENKSQCKKCEKFVLNDEMQSHMNAHTSQV